MVYIDEWLKVGVIVRLDCIKIHQHQARQGKKSAAIMQIHSKFLTNEMLFIFYVDFMSLLIVQSVQIKKSSE